MHGLFTVSITAQLIGMASYVNQHTASSYDAISFRDELAKETDSLATYQGVDNNELKEYLDLPYERKTIVGGGSGGSAHERWYRRVFNELTNAGTSIAVFIKKLFDCVRHYLPQIVEFLESVVKVSFLVVKIAKVLKCIAGLLSNDPERQVTWEDIEDILR